MTEHTLFDSADDDRDVVAGSQDEVATRPRPCVRHMIASSAEPRGGAPCQDGAGESPAHPLDSPARRVIHDAIMDKAMHEAEVGPTDSLWREISHETFMAMTEKEQLDYCARRDEDSARFADSEADAKFYLDRAARYRARLAEL